MKLTAPETEIINQLHSFEGDIVDFIKRLVAQPSVLGNEAGAVNVFERQLIDLGFSPKRIPVDHHILRRHPGYAPVPWQDQKKDNIVAVRPPDKPGKNKGRSLLLNGHLDVVSPEPLSFWDHDPYDPREKDGWLYGRGSGDMKAGVAVMMFAAHAIEKAGFGLSAPLTIEGVVEEECSGNGALACIQAGYDAEAVLIPEPFGNTILTHQVGVLWFKVTVRGVPHHVLNAGKGVNAVEKCYSLIRALRKLEKHMNETHVPAAYQHLDHPLHLNIGIIKGGDWPSTVPAEAEFHCRLSYFPGTSFDEAAKRIVDTIKEATAGDPELSGLAPRVEFYGFRSDGHASSFDLPAFQMLKKCRKTLGGRELKEYISTCTTDLSAFCRFGKGQATCFGPRGKNYHAANECVDLASVQHVARVYALFIARWCGLVE